MFFLTNEILVKTDIFNYIDFDTCYVIIRSKADIIIASNDAVKRGQ